MARYLAAPRLAAVVAAMAQARLSGFGPEHRNPSKAIPFISVQEVGDQPREKNSRSTEGSTRYCRPQGLQS